MVPVFSQRIHPLPGAWQAAAMALYDLRRTLLVPLANSVTQLTKGDGMQVCRVDSLIIFQVPNSLISVSQST